MTENRHRHCCPKCALFPTRRSNTIPNPLSSQLPLRKAYSLSALNNNSWKPFRPSAQTPVDWRRTRMVQKLMVDRVKQLVLERAREIKVEPAEIPVPSALLWSIREDGEEVGRLNWGAEMTANRESRSSTYAETVYWCWITENSAPKAAVFGPDDGVTVSSEGAMTVRGASGTKTAPGECPCSN